MSITHPVYGTDATRPTELRDFVRHAQRLGIRDYSLDVRTPDELHAVLVAIGGHNDYDPDRAAALIGDLIGTAMRVRVEAFTGGPAIYVELPFWTHQRIDAGPFRRMGSKYTDEERAGIAQQVMTAGRRLRANEIMARQFLHVGAEPVWSHTGPGADPCEVRLWWD